MSSLYNKEHKLIATNVKNCIVYPNKQFKLQKKDYSYEFYDKNNTLLFKNLRDQKNSKIYYSLFKHRYYTC